MHQAHGSMHGVFAVLFIVSGTLVDWAVAANILQWGKKGREVGFYFIFFLLRCIGNLSIADRLL